MIEQNVARMIDDDREAGDTREIQVIDGKAVRILDQDTVVGEETREAPASGRQRRRLAYGIPIPVNREVAKFNVAASATAQDGAGVEVGSGAQNAVAIANDDNVVGAVGELHFHGDFRYT